jgi:WD40 repeat protein
MTGHCVGDMTIRKWQSIDGKELLVLRGHTNIVRSICLSPDERHLVSASSDYSVRIWDLKTNQDKKVYVWSFEAALKQSGNQVRVRAYIAVVGIIFNWPCMMAPHSPTGS